MTKTLDALEQRDWGDEWDKLPSADDVELRPEPAVQQVTLRIGEETLEALRREARAIRVPYHVLARQWVVEGLRGRLPEVDPAASLMDVASVSDRQINLKLDSSLVRQLKRAAHGRRIPYHRLARLWIVSGLARAALPTQEQSDLAQPSPRLAMSDLVLLFLDPASASSGSDGGLRDSTRLQKLLFLVAQRSGLALRDRFYAYHYGPFSDEVDDAVEALRAEGLLAGEAGSGTSADSVADMLALIDRKRTASVVKATRYSLTPEGREAARRLRESDVHAQAVLPTIERVRRENDGLSTDEIVERVYAEFPAVIERSVIRDAVARRTARRSRSR